MTDAAWQALSPVIADLCPAPRTPADPSETARRDVAIAGQITGIPARPEQISPPVTDVRQDAALGARVQRLQPTQLAALRVVRRDYGMSITPDADVGAIAASGQAPDRTAAPIVDSIGRPVLINVFNVIARVGVLPMLRRRRK